MSKQMANGDWEAEPEEIDDDEIIDEEKQSLDIKNFDKKYNPSVPINIEEDTFYEEKPKQEYRSRHFK